MSMTSDPSATHPMLSYTDRLADQGADVLVLLGRVLMGWIFLSSGWSKLMDIPGFAASMARRGVPEFLGYIAPPVEFIGGLCLLLGLATRYAAVVMLVFVIFATFISHRYWTMEPAQVANQSTHFWKNVTIMGGMVLLFVTGGRRLSLDALLRRRPSTERAGKA